MVRPRNFALGSPTHADNAFQEVPAPEEERSVALLAIEEFDGFVATLRAAGLRITVLDDAEGSHLPDSVFPNNWFSTHEDGLLITYPLLWPERRRERREDIVEILDADYQINRTLALEHWEDAGRVLEGTGSLILDRQRRIAYVTYSERATHQAILDWCAACDYQPITFHAYGREGTPVYHTNVMMAVGTDRAIVCLESVTDAAERSKLREALAMNGKHLVEISLEQMENFCGNALEVSTPTGPAWVMSSRAHAALRPEQLEALHAPVLHAPLTNIEIYGGGSARCMLAEIFLPVRSK